MEELLGLIAELTGTVFAGACLYIALVQHPARMTLTTAAAIDEFRATIPRAERVQAPLLIACLLAVAASLALEFAWPVFVGGVVMLVVLAQTIVTVLPINRALLAGTADDHLATGAEAARVGARVGVVGGAGSLHVSEGGPQLADTDGFPAELADISNAHGDALNTLQASDESVDWFYFSPAAEFGAHNPGTRTGQYRVGTTVLLSDENGRSQISGPDYAIAFVDEITAPQHHRAQMHAAY